MKMLTVVVALLYCFSSHAVVLFSVEHKVQLKLFVDLAASFQTAKTRDEPMMQYPVILPMYDAESKPTALTLFCPPQMPSHSGEGCSLIIKGQLAQPGQMAISFKKSLLETSLNSLVAQLKTILATDPNSVEEWDHKIIASPFNMSSEDSTHVYCAAAGIAPGKAWDCFLSVGETSK